ncbi:hypothetical protein M422DRAFT_53672 [Sphaerobolus stellatus SS14]|uniref:Uncharacterized protein n=1 Tax=Sphaerobolus stellatus (strain SS14) TaxID=990650 RepID=A0A0C9UZN8_SPHS4|nr:hypothetical protein M422DRAFT_53672 [Sphaerobolus stellatus SS14]
MRNANDQICMIFQGSFPIYPANHAFDDCDIFLRSYEQQYVSNFHSLYNASLPQDQFPDLSDILTFSSPIENPLNIGGLPNIFETLSTLNSNAVQNNNNINHIPTQRPHNLDLGDFISPLAEGLRSNNPAITSFSNAQPQLPPNVPHSSFSDGSESSHFRTSENVATPLLELNTVYEQNILPENEDRLIWETFFFIRERIKYQVEQRRRRFPALTRLDMLYFGLETVLQFVQPIYEDDLLEGNHKDDDVDRG